MARAKSPNKAKKTLMKRVKRTNPKGNRKPKFMHMQSNRHHLKTKRSARAKRRSSGSKVVDATVVKKYNLK